VKSKRKRESGLEEEGPAKYARPGRTMTASCRIKDTTRSEGKVKVNISLCLSKYHAMKMNPLLN
jgi:hypothetical protein